MTNTHPAGVNCLDGINCGERLGGHCDGVLGELLPHLRYGRAHGCARPTIFCGRYLLTSSLCILSFVMPSFFAVSLDILSLVIASFFIESFVILSLDIVSFFMSSAKAADVNGLKVRPVEINADKSIRLFMGASFT